MKNNRPDTKGSLILFISIGILLNYGTYHLISVDYAGPLTATLLVILASVLLKVNGENWGDYGLKKPEKPWRLVWQAPLVLVGTVLTGIIVNNLLKVFFEVEPVIQVRHQGMEGNLTMFLWWVMLGWLVGGFIEEMIFRGFLLNRFERLFKSSNKAALLALLTQGLLFGLIHYYNRGIVGALTIFFVSLTFGAFYLKFKRNLWPLILAHGTVDTLSFLENYLGQ